MIPLGLQLFLEYNTRSNLKLLTYDPTDSSYGSGKEINKNRLKHKNNLQLHSPLCVSIFRKTCRNAPAQHYVLRNLVSVRSALWTPQRCECAMDV